MATPAGGKQGLRHTVVLLLLLVIIAIIAIRLMHSGSETSPQEQYAQGSLQDHSGRTEARTVDPVSAAEGAASNANGVQLDDAAAGDVEDTSGRRHSDNEVNLTVRLVDSYGAGIPFVEFAHSVQRGGKVPEPTLFQTVQADHSGVWQGTGAVFGTLWIRIADSRWRCIGVEADSRARMRDEPNLASVILTTKPEQTVTVKLAQSPSAGVCSIHVEYADGAPFDGELFISHYNDGSLSGKVSLSQRVAYAPGLTIPVTDGAALRFEVHSPRGGYRANTLVESTQEEVESAYIKIVVPEDPQRRAGGGVILDHLHFAADQRLVVGLVSERGGFVGQKFVLTGPGETRSNPMASGTTSSWMAIGAGVVWTYGPLRLEPGEWRRVKVEPVPAASLSLRICDHLGNPLAGAVVSAREVGHADWGSLGINFGYGPGFEPTHPTTENLGYFKNEMTRLMADGDGRVKFQWTWPGRRTYHVEAQGFESETVEVELKPGEQTEHGTVNLRPATGVIEVRTVLPDGRSGTEFRVWLYVRGRSLFGSPVRVLTPDGTLVIERVRAAGQIQVFVNAHPGGGRGWWRLVEVQVGDRKEVSIDLTREPGRQVD